MVILLIMGVLFAVVFVVLLFPKHHVNISESIRRSVEKSWPYRYGFMEWTSKVVSIDASKSNVYDSSSHFSKLGLSAVVGSGVGCAASFVGAIILSLKHSRSDMDKNVASEVISDTDKNVVRYVTAPAPTMAKNE